MSVVELVECSADATNPDSSAKFGNVFRFPIEASISVNLFQTAIDLGRAS